MGWINNTKKAKPEINEKYKDKGNYSVDVLIHLKIGLTFIAYWDFEEECWWSEATEIYDDEVMFWCKIPKLPKKDVQREKI